MTSSPEESNAVEQSTTDTTFISKLLGEMKSQFMAPLRPTKPKKNKSKEEVEMESTDNESKYVSSETTTLEDDDVKESVNVKTEESTNDTKTSDSTDEQSPKNKSMDENTVKRSSRRRSKESTETVLQSAIARKEKSFTVPSKPIRSTRQLKPTQKILENLAYAKQEKGKTDKNSPGDDSSSKRGKVRKRSSRDSKSPVKKAKLEEVESGESEVEIESGDPVRRSQRISSQIKDDVEEDPEESQLSLNVKITTLSPKFSSVGAELIASRLCLCTKKSQVFAEQNGTGSNYCSALDAINGKVIGCSRLTDPESPLWRASSRVPYISLCEMHIQRLLRHNCCPTCGLFCTQGDFAECESQHQYHRKCQISVGEVECCPHCGSNTPDQDIWINLHTKETPKFFKSRRVHCPAAKMSCNSVPKSPTPPPKSVYIFKANGLTDCYVFDDLLEAVNERNADLVAKIIASKTVDLHKNIEDENGGTILHVAAHKGLLNITHMLIVAGVDIDSLDAALNSPLMIAITEHHNDVVEYLIKAGASIALKGTDGMTCLHIAAKSGNLKACDLIVKSSSQYPHFIDYQDDGGWTPLVWACEHNFLDLVEFLIAKGANVRICDVEYNNALHWSAFSGNSSIMELLLNHGVDVNSVNVHGDTPLHIAGRENMYNAVITLLSRGAAVSLVNKNNETPLECVPSGSECYDLIALSIKLQVLTEADFKRHKYILTNDITKGKERNPIQCINMIDDESLPSDFTYITKNCITSESVQIDTRISNLESCSCEDKCISDSCSCATLNQESAYDNQNRLKDVTKYGAIFECNDLCPCNNITCTKRLVQKGITNHFQVFKTFLKGWGLRTLNFIPKGSFVCEYLGEVLTGEESDSREDDSYIFDLDSGENESFCIDAKFYGNISRFINHSCYANLTPMKVYAEHHDLRFPRIAMFATRDILANEEVSFDYGEKFWSVKSKSFTCQCGTTQCKYSEEKINQIVELIDCT